MCLAHRNGGCYCVTNFGSLYSLFLFQSLNSRVLYEIHIILIVHIPSCKPSERKRPIPYPRHCRCCPMSDCGRGGSNYRTLMVYCGEPVQPIAVILICCPLFLKSFIAGLSINLDVHPPMFLDQLCFQLITDLLFYIKNLTGLYSVL